MIPIVKVAVLMLALAGRGWRFDRWEGAVTGAANPGTVVMTEDRNVKAVFLPLGGSGSHACGAAGKTAYACGMVLLWAASHRRGKALGGGNGPQQLLARAGRRS